jgi:hypothetical protein
MNRVLARRVSNGWVVWRVTPGEVPVEVVVQDADPARVIEEVARWLGVAGVWTSREALQS